MAARALNFVKAIVEIVVYSNVWVAICGVCLLWTNYLILDLPINLYHLFFFFFGILFTYNVQRFYELNITIIEADDPRRAWIKANQHFIKSICLLSFSVLLLFCFFLPFRVYLFLLPAAIVTYLYTFPTGFLSKKYLRLREIPGVKIFLVALVWSYSSAVLLVADRSLDVSPQENFQVFFINFLLCVAITLPFDIRDEKIDSQLGLRTLVSQFGKLKVILFACFCILLMSGLIVFGGYIESSDYFRLMLHALISFVCIACSNRFRKSEMYFTCLLDGLLVIRWVLLWF